MVLIRDEVTSDGHSLRRFHDLKLERARSPVFALSWQIMHRIDEASPLYGVTAQAIEDGDMRLAVTLSGVDETIRRHMYGAPQLLARRRPVRATLR